MDTWLAGRALAIARQQPAATHLSIGKTLAGAEDTSRRLAWPFLTSPGAPSCRLRQCGT